MIPNHTVFLAVHSTLVNPAVLRALPGKQQINMGSEELPLALPRWLQ